MKSYDDVPVAAYVPPILRSNLFYPIECKLIARYNHEKKTIDYKYQLLWNELHDVDTSHDSFDEVKPIKKDDLSSTQEVSIKGQHCCCSISSALDDSVAASLPLATSTPKSTRNDTRSQNSFQRLTREIYSQTAFIRPFEMLFIKALEFEVLPVNRRQTRIYEGEVSGSTTLEKCLIDLIGPRPYSHGQIFLVKKNRSNKYHLILINKETNKDLELYKIASIQGKPELQIAVDYSGQMRAKQTF